MACCFLNCSCFFVSFWASYFLGFFIVFEFFYLCSLLICFNCFIYWFFILLFFIFSFIYYFFSFIRESIEFYLFKLLRGPWGRGNFVKIRLAGSGGEKVVNKNAFLDLNESLITALLFSFIFTGLSIPSPCIETTCLPGLLVRTQ